MSVTVANNKTGTVTSVSGTTFTSSGFAAGDVGRCIVMTGGNARGQMRKVMGYTSATVVTLDYAWNVSPFADYINDATGVAFAEVAPVSTDAWAMSSTLLEAVGTGFVEVATNVYELTGTATITVPANVFLYDKNVTLHCNTTYFDIVVTGFVRFGDINENGDVFNGIHLIELAETWNPRSWTNNTDGDAGDLHIYNSLISIIGTQDTGMLWGLFDSADSIHRLVGCTFNGDFGMRIRGDESIIKDVLFQGQSDTPIADAGVSPYGTIGMINNMNNITKNNVFYWEHSYGSFVARNVGFSDVTSTLVWSAGGEDETGLIIGFDADEVELLPSMLNVQEADPGSTLTLQNPIITSVVDLSLSTITDSYKRVIWDSTDTTADDTTVTDGDWDEYAATWWTITTATTGLRTLANGTTTTPYTQAIISYLYMPNLLIETLRAPSNVTFTGILDDAITQTTKTTVDAYTLISNGERLYDRSKSWTFDNFDDQFPSQGGLLINAAGALLDLGAVNLTINGAAASAFAVSQTGDGTITIDAGTTLGINFFTTIKTTGDITIEDGTIVDDWIFNGDVYINHALDLDGVTIIGDVHYNTGANSTIDFTGVTVTGNVYNDAGSNTLTVTKNSTTTATAGDAGTGNGQTNVQQTIAIKVIVKDAITLDLLENARVLLQADTGGDLPAGESVTITRVTTTATVAHTAHGMLDSTYVIIKGATQNEYNGAHQITYISANSYSYTVAGTPTTPATGTIIATARIVNELTDSFGEVNTTMSYTTDQPIVGVARKGTL